MLCILISKQSSLHNNMISLENDIFARIKENNIFNLMEQQLDDATSVFYDPKLFLYQSSYDNLNLLTKYQINYQLSLSQTMTKLNMITNPKYQYPLEQQQEAANLKKIIMNDQSDLQGYFNRQYQFINQSLSNYSQFFDKVQNMNIESLKNQKFLSSSNANIFQFAMNGTYSDNFNLHFTNPIPMQKISKDVAIVLNNFQDAQSVLKTIHETCTVFDRIWIFRIEGESSYSNIIKLLYQRDYLSLQTTLNCYSQIEQYIQQISTMVNNVDFKLIQYLVNTIILQLGESHYTVQFENQNQKKQSSQEFEVIIYIFGQNIFININIVIRNVNIFFIHYLNTNFNQNTINTMDNIVLIDYISKQDFISVKLWTIIRILNCLYVSTKDEISSVNSSVLISRAIYRNDQYIGMLLINEQLFGSFADMTINNIDGLTATTLKVRMMDKQIPILNPYYQFSQTVSYQNETPQPLIQTIPGILNNYPQNQFSDIVSAKIITIHKSINSSAGSFIEYLNEYYYMQVIRNELTIHIGLSSTVITTKSRYSYSNVYYCVPPQQIQFNISSLNLSELRFTVHHPFQITRQDCLFSDGYNCMFKTDVDIYRKAKEQISYQKTTDLQYLCGYNYTSTKFFLNTDSDDFLLYLQTIPEFGNISTLVKDYNDFKTATLYMNYTNQDKVVLKYYRVMPNYQKLSLVQNWCVMVIQNGQFISSSTFASLRGLQTVSPNILYLIYQQNREIIHFARYIPSLEYLLDNPLIEAVYLGHSWVSNQDRNYADLLEQQTFVENETGTNEDLKVVNRVCVEIARLYNNQYFVFSSNPKNNEIVRTEQLKSNIDGTNLKFRLSVVNGQTFLTKPLISKNKSLLSIPRVGGYLTLQLKVEDVFENISEKTSFLIMDATGSTVYHQKDTNTDQFAFGVKQLLIKYGYLVETFSNSTVQSVHRSCTRNHEFWETAYQRSLDDEFTVVVSNNISKPFNFLKQADYNKSAVYERSVIFKAESQFFLGGYITIKEFSILNEFVVLLHDVMIMTTHNQSSEQYELSWKQQQQENMKQYIKNIPHNLSALDLIYPNLTRRGQIPQKILRIQFKHVNKHYLNGLLLITIIASQGIFVLYLLSLVTYDKRPRKFHKQFKDYIEKSTGVFFNVAEYGNNDYLDLTMEQTLPPQKQVALESLSKYVDRVKQRLLLQKVNLIFAEKNMSVADCLKIIQLFEDEHQANIFRYVQIQPAQYYYRSFTVFIQQKLYADFVMNLKNRITWIPNEAAAFKSDLKLIKRVSLTFVPSKRYVSINNKNVSKLVTRLQTAIQSTMQSRIHSKPISRQEYVEEIQDLPFWFYNSTAFRLNENPCMVKLFMPSNYFQNPACLYSLNILEILQYSVDQFLK
ncbi:Conserved_hypothetical protein [Hexamita inflata]|uniref:Transmembrane protein n=1 Tax=Hexamita inflata TaxID=28002 RepID=A0AA86PGR9_9EUKA|nr:Conserved hypothetical protein [Hexamita inflata]